MSGWVSNLILYLFVAKAAAVLLVKVRANRFVESCEGHGVKENGPLSCMLQIENSIYAIGSSTH